MRKRSSTLYIFGLRKSHLTDIARSADEEHSRRWCDICRYEIIGFWKER